MATLVQGRCHISVRAGEIFLGTAVGRYAQKRFVLFWSRDYLLTIIADVNTYRLLNRVLMVKLLNFIRQRSKRLLATSFYTCRPKSSSNALTDTVECNYWISIIYIPYLTFFTIHLEDSFLKYRNILSNFSSLFPS